VVFLSTIPAEDNQLQSTSPEQYEYAYRYNAQGWIYVYIQGDPYDRGYQHGHLLSAEIIDAIHRWSNIIHNHPRLKPFTGDISSARYDQVSERWWTFCTNRINKMYWKTYPNEYQEEIQGIADGVTDRGGRIYGREVTYKDILGINEMYEFMTKLENQIKSIHPLRTFIGSLQKIIPGLPTSFSDSFIATFLSLPKAHHCSAFIATGEATSNGQIVATHVTQCGGWWYTFDIAQRWNVILDIEPTHGHRFQMTTSPGYIWSDENFYQNSNGIIVMDTTVPQGLWKRTGLPFAIRTRTAAQYSNNIDDAINYLMSQNDGIWTTVLLFGDTKTGEIARLDLGLYKSKIWRTTDGYHFSANNLMDVSVRAETNGFGIKGFILKLLGLPGHVYSTIRFYHNPREEKMIELADQYYGDIDVDIVKEIMSTPPCENPVAFDCKITDTTLIDNNGFWAYFGYQSGEIIDVSTLKNLLKNVKDVPPSGWMLLYGVPSNFVHQLKHQTFEESIDEGQVLWSVGTGKENNTEYAQSIIAGDMVYSVTTSDRVYCLHAVDGGILWEKELEGLNALAPCLSQEKIFVGSDSGVYALKKHGEMNWSTPIGLVVSQLIADDACVFVGTDEGVHALSVDQGELMWEYHMDSPAYLSSLWNDMIFVGSGKACYALDSKTGDMRWFFSGNAPFTSSPRVHKGLVYAGCWDGNLYVLDAETGDLQWQYQTGWGIDNTPLIDDEVVFFGSMDNNLYALDVDDGELLWVFTTQAGIHSSPAVYGEYVFFGSDDGRFYAINCSTGDQVWSFSPGYCLEQDVYTFNTTSIFADPVVDDGRVIIGIKGTIYALDPQTTVSAHSTVSPTVSEIQLGASLFVVLPLLLIAFVTSLYLFFSKKRMK
jgi:outer membrane protein assembly factor BamB